MSSRMSKDRVKFTMRGYYFETDKARILLGNALGVNAGQFDVMRRMAQDSMEGVEIICRPSQFARFLIMREAAGFQNMFKELKAELIPAPTPTIQPVDVSGNPPRSY